MVAGKKYLNDDIFYTVFKKHFCPQCGEKLERIEVSKVINSSSPEAKDYDFAGADSFMVGDVEFIWKEFYCAGCKKQISVKEMQQIEYEQESKRV